MNNKELQGFEERSLPSSALARLEQSKLIESLDDGHIQDERLMDERLYIRKRFRDLFGLKRGDLIRIFGRDFEVMPGLKGGSGEFGPPGDFVKFNEKPFIQLYLAAKLRPELLPGLMSHINRLVIGGSVPDPGVLYATKQIRGMLGLALGEITSNGLVVKDVYKEFRKETDPHSRPFSYVVSSEIEEVLQDLEKAVEAERKLSILVKPKIAA